MVATVQLPRNKTHSHRYVTFIRVTPKDRQVGGVIEIREAASETGKAKCCRYAICERSHPEMDDDDRAFRLTKPGGEAYYDLYLCTDPNRQIDDDRPYDSCDCVGFERHGRCKHVQALRALLEKDQL